ncbi:alginate lyase family protein [Roseomonas xinghualingensis]|uniref:alginate lyase family protein n=1 Tax=Roseomonas xinghualingensis TaxID=2986475 RepID=UPI0021F0B5ED|nr:alginate lyase family protein [Roseomonas sp. SXEYE001]MCV4207614.1 alginate lyase family protein [Roseomonas sp. SXEYE001]
MRRSLILGALLASIALRAQARPARLGTRAMAGPFNPLPEASGPGSSCEARPEPVRSLEGIGFYMDPAFSQADPARMQADAEAARPLADWLAAIQKAVEGRRRGEGRTATCALSIIDHWARNDALLGAFNREGGYHRKRALAGAALSFLAIREAPGLDPVALGRTARWLGEVGRAVQPHYERRSEALISDVRNNEAAWAGLAVAASGIAAEHRGMLDWGVARLRGQLDQVDERGTLPQEVARKGMALHCHLSALEAVAGLERLAAANGIALNEAERAAYRRLRDLCLAAAKEPARMAAIAGAEQQDPWLGERSPLEAAPGLELASIAMPDPASDEALAPFRPYASPWLGGMVTGWWKG